MAPTGLWERFCFRQNGAAPFGLCFSNSPDLDDFFSGSIRYNPEYIPEGTFFEIIPNNERKFLPWTCRLPAIRKQPLSGEPMNHAQEMRSLTRVKIGVDRQEFRNEYTAFIESSDVVEFYHAGQHQLILEFDKHQQGRMLKFKKSPLIIAY